MICSSTDSDGPTLTLSASCYRISCIKHVRSQNFIRRDIKPDDFLMGIGKRGNQVNVIDFDFDFGLAKKSLQRQGRRLQLYGVFSTVLVSAVIASAFHKHSDFYFVAVLLSWSSASVMVSAYALAVA